MSILKMFKMLKDMIWLACLPTEDKKYGPCERVKSQRKSIQPKKSNLAMNSSLLEDGFLMPRKTMDKPAFAVDMLSSIEMNDTIAGNDRRIRYAQCYDSKHLPFETNK